MIAISTPAQKPRGSASSTVCTGRRGVEVTRSRVLAPGVASESYAAYPYPGRMPAARVLAVAPGSPAQRAGIATGDEILAVNGEQLRDVIAYQLHADGAEVDLEVRRGGLEQQLVVHKAEGAPLGLELAHAIFDRVQTCDNHCPFCFIHQLPKGMRRSLYLQDDDFRLSFLYGNFTTLTRFTEADFERVITEKLSPLYVSIHATDPEVRTRLLRNRRGRDEPALARAAARRRASRCTGRSSCAPGINDGAVLDDTMLGVLDRFPQLATLGVVPLGVSAHSHEPEMRPHTDRGGARPCVDIVHAWQERFVRGARPPARVRLRRVLPARRAATFPPLDAYDDCSQHENGIGMARTFEAEVAAALAGADVRADRHPFGLLRRGRRRAGRGLPRAARSRSTVSTRRRGADAGAAPADRHRHRRARRAGARAARARARRAGRAPRCGSCRSPTGSSAATSASPACSRAPTSRPSSPASPTATATCCPT